MKTMLTIFFLFLAFTAKPFLGAADAASDPVLDITGEKLQTGAYYYIVSIIRGGGGGGVTLAAAGNNTCPTSVVQETSDLQRGLPVTFSPVNSAESVIRESTDLNVKFSVSPICKGSVAPVWKVDNYDESTGQWFVSIGGVEGNPGPQTLTNWFKIQKSTGQGVYNLVYCPSVCDSCIHLCSDIGRYWEELGGRPRLALSKEPFRVVFIKAEESANERIFNVI